MTVQRFPVRVFLEDTDAQGIVYHANYLKYCERARTEILGTIGYPLGRMQEQGLYFVVYEMKLKFHKPARLHEDLSVHTTTVKGSDYRLTFKQNVFRGEEEKPIFTAEVIVVTIDHDGQLTPMPDELVPPN
jgi:acyl-CoA thioester hydrolase